MSESLPHLTVLRVFKASARNGSLQAAASELGPSAVSHRIHALAAYLDVRLFERRVRAVELTVPGNTLWLKLADGFRLIESAVREVHTLQAPAEIAVSAGPAIVAK